jgi:hypothetical protein
MNMESTRRDAHMSLVDDAMACTNLEAGAARRDCLQNGLLVHSGAVAIMFRSGREGLRLAIYLRLVI